jgi:hypothetical protein
MKMFLRALSGAAGLLALLVAARLWMAPAETALQLGLAASGDLGLATLRADMGGFFAAGGVFALAAAVRGRGGPLIVPVILIGLALAGRLFTLAVTGFAENMGPPMAIEAVLLVIFAAGWRLLPR